jgi:hypothetical protein
VLYQVYVGGTSGVVEMTQIGEGL